MSGAVKGRIIRGIGGFYYVKDAKGREFSCKAKGLFRKQGTKPLVGDMCMFEEVPESDPDSALPVGSITEILPRKNELIRPAVANVDQAVLFFALKDPDVNPGLLDGFLVQMELGGIPAALVFNKSDLDEQSGMEQRLRDRFANAPYRLFFISVKEAGSEQAEGSSDTASEDEEGLDSLRALLKGRCSVLAGPSGAGKSSFINLIAPHALMETGSISQKTQRGKHTTRRSELISLDNDTFIFDTPGFTALDYDSLTKEDVQRGFAEIRKWSGECRFSGCSHITEPGCRVLEKLEEGQISRERYSSYVSMYKACGERKRY